jgi:hypothetical protein
MRKYSVVSLLFVLTACSSSTEPEPFWATYQLQSYNGETLPAVRMDIPGGKLEWLSGTIRLNSDMTFSDSVTARYPNSGRVDTLNHTDTGTFSVSGDSLFFRPSFFPTNWPSTPGLVVDGTLTKTQIHRSGEEVQQFTLVYVMQ